MKSRTPDEQRAAAAEDCARCGAAPGITCRGERGAPVPHHAERWIAADRTATANAKANTNPPRRIARGTRAPAPAPTTNIEAVPAPTDLAAMTTSDALNRLDAAKRATPIGSTWADPQSGVVYRVEALAFAVGDLSATNDTIVSYRSILNADAPMLARSCVSFIMRFHRRS